MNALSVHDEACSRLFQVHNTHIGTAKATKRIKTGET